jgi:hypothetical protein
MDDVSRGCLELAVVDNWRGAARKYRVVLVGWELVINGGRQRDELGVWSALVWSGGKKVEFRAGGSQRMVTSAG